MTSIPLCFERFRDDVLSAWRKKRLPSYLRRRAVEIEDIYYPDTREKYIVAWVQVCGKCYAVDVTYSYSPAWLDLTVSELPDSVDALRGLGPLLVRSGAIVYTYSEGLQ